MPTRRPVMDVDDISKIDGEKVIEYSRLIAQTEASDATSAPGESPNGSWIESRTHDVPVSVSIPFCEKGFDSDEKTTNASSSSSTEQMGTSWVNNAFTTCTSHANSSTVDDQHAVNSKFDEDDEDISPATLIRTKRHALKAKKRSGLLQRISKNGKAPITKSDKLKNSSAYDYGEDEELFDSSPISFKSPTPSPGEGKNDGEINNLKRKSKRVLSPASIPRHRDRNGVKAEEITTTRISFASSSKGASPSATIAKEEDIPTSILESSNLHTKTFHDIWEALKEIGWYSVSGKGLVDWFYVRPMAPEVPKSKVEVNAFLISKPKPDENPPFFASPSDVIEYLDFRRSQHSTLTSCSVLKSASALVAKSGEMTVLHTNSQQLCATPHHDQLKSISLTCYDWDELTSKVHAGVLQAFPQQREQLLSQEIVSEDIPISLCAFIDIADAFFFHIMQKPLPPSFLGR